MIITPFAKLGTVEQTDGVWKLPIRVERSKIGVQVFPPGDLLERLEGHLGCLGVPNEDL